MFFQVFLFEIKYRLRRPAFYVYFLLILLVFALTFASGKLPLASKEHINAPASLALMATMASLFLMLISSSIMGVPLYRDIEHNTKEYYLSYPITKAGYFWGRYAGSFLFVILIASAVFLGAWLGRLLGPRLGWTDETQYGADHFRYYLYPFLTLTIPTLFFTSSLFFGLVAFFRNVKVIYSSGLFLFLGYILSNFFLHEINNPTVIYLSDPFLINGMRMELGSSPTAALNGSVVHMNGLIGINRILWTSIGMIILLLTWWQFSFERFFGRSSKRQSRTVAPPEGNPGMVRNANSLLLVSNSRFDGGYFRKILYSLTRLELLSIIRDNYFWMILSAGLIFLSFVFWHGPGHMGVNDYPMTSFFMTVFSDDFSFFLFLIIIFYTGETVQRDRLTKFAFINDALPPPTWVLNIAKLLSLCCMAIFLSLTPVWLGVLAQLGKGYYHFNFPLYFSVLFALTLPKLLLMVLFSYAIHIVVNNKFAAHGVGITIYLILVILYSTGNFSYNLLLYSFGPNISPSDSDGLGHLLRPLLWFNGYWLIAGALLVVTGSLFYPRGTDFSLKERRRLAGNRWRGTARTGIWVLLVAFLAMGGYIYYNVSYLNNYLTKKEGEDQGKIIGQVMKRYAPLPIPSITRATLYTDLYPEEQKGMTKAILTIRNNGKVPMDSLLLNGNRLAQWSLQYNGILLNPTDPLHLPRGKFNWFRPAIETSRYRLYRLPVPLMPGDSARLELNTVMGYRGFLNQSYGLNFQHNGTYFNGGLPDFGYGPHRDENAGNDSPQMDIILSTSSDQVAVAPGTLEKEWVAGDRRYFHYVQRAHDVQDARPVEGAPLPLSIAAARYAVFRDTLQLTGRQQVLSEIYYHPADGINRERFAAAQREGLTWYSKAFGSYPYPYFRLIEIPNSNWPPINSVTGTTFCNELFGWNADLRNPGQLDYCYYTIAEQLARQWWGLLVVPGQGPGASLISEGLPKYAAMVLTEKKYGEQAGLMIRETEARDYFWSRRRNANGEKDLLHSYDGNVTGSKAAIVLYGLRDLIGEENLNTALLEFRNEFASKGPVAGGDDLYKVLQAHTPDSFRYYLDDNWKNVCLYDNKILAASAIPLAGGAYKVNMTVRVNKLYYDSSGREKPATAMNDYIDIGVTGVNPGNPKQELPLCTERRKFIVGEHRIELIVKGKPAQVVIDPLFKLMDRQRGDNKRAIGE